MNLIKGFRRYLKLKKLSKVSVKNYLSDVRQFLNWSAKNGLKSHFPLTFSTYRSSLINSKTPTSTINRHLSSLRHFGRFLKAKRSTINNPVENLKNIQVNNQKSSKLNPSLLEDFRTRLKKERLKPATIKNYLSDVNQFLNWLNHEKPK